MSIANIAFLVLNLMFFSFFYSQLFFLAVIYKTNRPPYIVRGSVNAIIDKRSYSLILKLIVYTPSFSRYLSIAIEPQLALPNAPCSASIFRI